MGCIRRARVNMQPLLGSSNSSGHLVAPRDMKGIAASKFGGEPLATAWSKWTTEHHRDGWPSGQLPYTIVTRHLLGEMQSSGYMIPPRRQMEDLLARGVDPLEAIQSP